MRVAKRLVAGRRDWGPPIEDAEGEGIYSVVTRKLSYCPPMYGDSLGPALQETTLVLRTLCATFEEAL